jgi:hypothetical protein
MEIRMKSMVPDLLGEVHHIHLAAIGAPTLNIAVQFADEASRVFSTYREKYEVAASDMKAGCGNIYNSRNLLVARISYNARIWDTKGCIVE